ncbi:MAG: aminotransferase class I/II-fold pyridoxal phosphate-dependent enzyme, partial [Brevibacterium linens]
PARHIPYAALTEATAAHTATATAASKAFNIPGLKCAQLILTSSADRDVWAEKGQFVSGAASNPGILATTAAYTRSSDWLSEVNGYLKANRDHFTDLVGSLLPGAAYIEPEGTYLAWLDLRGYGLESGLSALIRSRAEVAVTEGRLCGEVGAGHIRFNFALPRPLLTEAVERIARIL